jgi:hypothetical protein
MEPAQVPSALPQLVFFFIIAIPLAIVMWAIAKRKGKSGLLALLFIVPLVNMLVALWLASLPDKALLDRISDLEGRLPPKL